LQGSDLFRVTAHYTTGYSPYATVYIALPGNEDGLVPPPLTALQGNYPNPFNPETTIAFSLAENGPVRLCVYNARGEKVRTLMEENLRAGDHTAVWNGLDANGRAVGSGVYFYRLEAGNKSFTRKALLLK
jgi:hypothetical protein